VTASSASSPLSLHAALPISPRRQQVHPLLGLAGLAGLGGVHIDAVGAPVELRGADLDQPDEGLVEAGADFHRCRRPGLHGGGGGGEVVESAHGGLPWDSRYGRRSPGPRDIACGAPCATAAANGLAGRPSRRTGRGNDAWAPPVPPILPGHPAW